LGREKDGKVATSKELRDALDQSLMDIAGNGVENRTSDGRMQRMADPESLANALEVREKFNTARIPAYRNTLAARPYRG
jgi:hypothetical protein